MIEQQDAEPIPSFTSTQNMSLPNLVAAIEEIVPIFSEDLLVEDD